MREMTRISFRLLEVFALGLGLPPRALDSMFQPAHTSFLRLNYYVSSDSMASCISLPPATLSAVVLLQLV